MKFVWFSLFDIEYHYNDFYEDKILIFQCNPLNIAGDNDVKI